MSPMLTRLLKALLPLLVLGVALAAAFVMWANRPPVETLTPVVTPPAVRVQTVAFESVDLTVSSQGTVQPRTASQLVPEIAGTVLDVSPAFAVGGFFEEGEVLLEIDPYDYQQALIAARSQLAQAQLRLAQAEAEAEVARREWEEIGQGDANPLTLRLPQVEDARAAVASAEAAIDRATRDLERAEVRAPYARAGPDEGRRRRAVREPGHRGGADLRGRLGRGPAAPARRGAGLRRRADVLPGRAAAGRARRHPVGRLRGAPLLLAGADRADGGRDRPREPGWSTWWPRSTTPTRRAPTPTAPRWRWGCSWRRRSPGAASTTWWCCRGRR